MNDRIVDREICACGKRSFGTKEIARRRHPRLHVYRCPLSDQYHVRSKISRRQVVGR